MDNVLIEIAIGLVLVYASLSLLLMKLQEMWHGGLLRGRVQNMHRLVFEAVGQDAALRDQLFGNPLLFALSTGDKAQEGNLLAFKRVRGPSAIPPDLFARALLMELNPSGRPPSEDHPSPLAFIDAIDKAAAVDSRRASLLRGLRGLMAGSEADWAGFEAAIARWFSDIGDRSEGWFKRRTGQVGMALAVLLCVVLNVDTRYIADTLGRDPALRSGLGQLAEGLLQERAGGAAPAPAAAASGAVTVIVDPEARVQARLVDAIARLREAFQRDKEIARYGPYISDAEKACRIDTSELLSASVPPIDPGGKSGKGNEGKAAPAALPEGRYLSNSDTWQTVLPGLLTYIERSLPDAEERDDRSPGQAAHDRATRLRHAFGCLSHVSAWVRAAATASDRADTRRLMQEAGIALEDSKSGLLALVRGSESQASLRHLFVADPAAFVRCARLTPPSLSELDRCVRREQDLLGRLPIGHSAANRRQQFCTVVEAVAPAAGKASATGWGQAICGDDVAPSLPQFGASAMALQFQPWNLLDWSVGVLVSALFISLGAPFWFDLLSRLVRIRNAGAVREADQNRAKGAGTQPLPAPAGGAAPAGGGAAGGAAQRPGGSAGSPATLPAVEGSSNRFEDQLLPREILALQMALGVAPASGKLDGPTREAIRNACRDRGLGDTDRLSLATYTRLAGRAPVQARDVIGPVLGSRPQLRSPYALAATLGAHLNLALDFGRRIPANETVFSDDLRALAVLYRYKTDATLPLNQRQVFEITLAHPEQLDEIDEDLLRRILAPAAAPLARDPAPWLDWALGELGQVECRGSSRGSSNPRVCTYLDAVSANLGNQGDDTPWCGAFVTWVLQQHNAERPNERQHIVGTPEGAKNWLGWVRTPAGAAATLPPVLPAVAGRVPTPGDVEVVAVGGGHHVGFVLEVDAAANVFWLLGGNQAKGSRVCLSRFKLGDLAV